MTHWLRINGTNEQWAGRGIRVNAIAPGAIMTPLLQGQLDDPELAKGIESFPVPIGGYGDPADIAAWVVFMLGSHAKFLCGSVIFVDGGTDAYFRPADWPKAIPADQYSVYQQKVADFAQRRTGCSKFGGLVHFGGRAHRSFPPVSPVRMPGAAAWSACVRATQSAGLGARRAWGSARASRRAPARRGPPRMRPDPS